MTPSEDSPPSESVDPLAYRCVLDRLSLDVFQDAFAGLSPRERHIVRLHYGLDGINEPLNLAEIGRRIGCSRQWARELHETALRKLREACTGSPEPPLKNP